MTNIFKRIQTQVESLQKKIDSLSGNYLTNTPKRQREQKDRDTKIERWLVCGDRSRLRLLLWRSRSLCKGCTEFRYEIVKEQKGLLGCLQEVRLDGFHGIFHFAKFFYKIIGRPPKKPPNFAIKS